MNWAQGSAGRGAVLGADTVAADVPFMVLFSPPVIRRTLLAVILMTAGLTVSYGYTNWLPTFFIKQGMSLNTSIGFTVIMSLGGTLGALIAFCGQRQVRPQAEPHSRRYLRARLRHSVRARR